MRLNPFSNGHNSLFIINFIFVKWRMWVVLSSFTIDILFFYFFKKTIRRVKELEMEMLTHSLLFFIFFILNVPIKEAV